MRILRREETERKTGLRRTAIDAREREGKFPKRIRLSGTAAKPRVIGWLEDEVDAWIAAKAAERGDA